MTLRVTVLAFFGLGLAGLSFAHDAPLDSRGCHCSDKGDLYHCHEGALEDSSFRSTREAERAWASDADVLSPGGYTVITPPRQKQIAKEGDVNLAIRNLLQGLGYDIGPGGLKTAEAIRKFQNANRMRKDGTASGALLVRLSEVTLERLEAAKPRP